MSLATISIVGNLVRQPEQICFASGQKKTTIVVAVNAPKNPKHEEAKADFYKVESWGRLGELALEYLSKGNQVTVCGKLSFDHWIDKSGGQRTTPVVQANQLAFPQRLRVLTGDGHRDGGTTSGVLSFDNAQASSQPNDGDHDSDIFDQREAQEVPEDVALSEVSKTPFRERQALRKKA